MRFGTQKLVGASVCFVKGQVMTEKDILTLFRRARLLLVPVGCQYMPKGEVDKLRRQFNKSIRGAFKATANDNFRRYPAHHIIPLKLGGNNEATNLALVQPILHDAIHEYLDYRINLIKPRVGDKFNLIIPMKLGSLWM